VKNVLILSLALFSTAAYAQPATPATPAASDPNEMICRNIQETGSMLARSRVCMTRAQWAEQNRQDRASIERAQSQQRTNGH
jgi:hypothetical protein